MKTLFLTGIFATSLFILVNAQVSITSGGSNPDPSAMLEVNSSSKGLLIPRMTTSQIAGIPQPANGLQAFNTDNGKLYIFVSADGKWKEVSYGTGIITPINCGFPITDARDGKSYNTTLIGSRCWMAQNLDIGIKILVSADQLNNNILEKYCYGNADSNCAVYGGLYQWGEMVQYLNGASNTTSWNPVPAGNVTGICPSGWHLPTENEWDTLIIHLDPDAGGKMKETGTAHWDFPNFGATNESGFTCLPAGMVTPGGYFQWLGGYAEIWTASTGDTHWGWMKWLWSNMAGVGGSSRTKDSGLAVRCVKN